MSGLMHRFARASSLATAAAATAALGVLPAAPALARPATTVGTQATAGSHVRLTKVVDLRVGAHRRFDRVVIDFVGRVPRHDVRYVRRLQYDGSGDHVPLKGRKFVAVSLTSARAHGPNFSDIYAGPDLQQYSFDTLRGVALTGDFEGSVGFGLSLRRHAHLHVFVLHSPNRLVIDMRT
jgi:hypothetical protein